MPSTPNPYTGAPTIAPALEGTRPLSQEVDPRAFGGALGEAETRLGGVAEHAGNELFERAIAMQQLNNHMDAVAAVGRLSDSIGDEELKFRSLRGMAANRGYDDFKTNVNKIREETASTLTNPYAKSLYEGESRAIQSRAIMNAGIHAGDQFKEAYSGSLHSEVDAAGRYSMANPMSDEAWNRFVDKANSSGDAMMGPSMGFTQAQRDDYVAKHLSQGVDMRARALAATDVGAAQKFIEDSRAKGIAIEPSTERYVRYEHLNVGSRVETAKISSGDIHVLGNQKLSDEQTFKGIVQTESGGNYTSKTPYFKLDKDGSIIKGPDGKGIVAGYVYGAGQVKDTNLKSWLKEAGQPDMSPEDYLQNKAAQDAAIMTQIKKMQAKPGATANRIAAEWFTGNPDAPLTQGDGTTTLARHLKNFNQNLFSSLPEGMVDKSARSHAETISKDPEFTQAVGDRTIAEQRKQIAVADADERQNRQLVWAEVRRADPTSGKYVTSVDDFQNPEAKAAFAKLRPDDQELFKNRMMAHATQGYARTPANQDLYHQLIGQMTSDDIPQDLRADLLKTNLYGLPLPKENIDHLVSLQDKLLHNSATNPRVNEAMNDLKPVLRGVIGEGKDLDKDAYYQIKGALHERMLQYKEDTGKDYKPEEIRAIADRLVTQKYTDQGWFGTGIYRGTQRLYQIEVPPDKKADIISKWTERYGSPPDPAQIEGVYHASLTTSQVYNDLYAKGKLAP